MDRAVLHGGPACADGGAGEGSAQGTITTDFSQLCGQPGPDRARAAAVSELTETLLIVNAGSGSRLTSFVVNRVEAGRPSNPGFTASAAIVHSGYSFFSEVELSGRQTAFAVPDLKTLSEATVDPPAPFSGTAVFELVSQKTSRWSGDLAVELPGFGQVPLTGKGFHSDLCHSQHCTETSPAVGRDMVDRP